MIFLFISLSGVREILECWFDDKPIRDEYLIVKGGRLAGAGHIPTAKVMQLAALMKLLDSKKVKLSRVDHNSMSLASG